MIRCYNCGNELDKGSYCPYCNADVGIYKKIVAKSYALYNEALKVAKLRDISRAIPLLKSALKAYKANTDARNLLGLCYYEVGDVMVALKEWVISKNLQPNDNLASEYLSVLRSNRQRLESMNSIIRKYNLALRDCNHGKMDVAIIQLKKVTSSKTLNILKAKQLLAMIYIKSEEYKKALDILRQAEKIDRYNPTTLSYIKEIEENLYDKARGKKSVLSKEKKEDEPTSPMPKDEYFSYVSYKEPSPMVAIGSLIFGILLGGFLVWLLIVPAKVQSVSKDYNKEINRMSEKNAVLQNNIDNLQDEIASYKQEANDIKSETQDKLKKVKMSKQLLSAFVSDKNNNIKEAKDSLSSIEPDKLSDNERVLYYDLAVRLYDDEIKSTYKNAYDEFRKKNYNNAIKEFKKVLKWDPTNDEALYNLALCYINKDEKVTAEAALKEYIQLLPNGKHSKAANRDLIKIESELNMGGDE